MYFVYFFHSRPSLLITDAYNAMTSFPLRKDRDQLLASNDKIKYINECIVFNIDLFFCFICFICLAQIHNTLMRGGNVLLPVDSAGRCLESAMVLHNLWEIKKYAPQFTLAFLSHQSWNTLNFASGLIEWMSEACQKQLDQKRDNPFALKQLIRIQSMQELHQLPK
jgi:cleavage and polyadenylation specificity factor subunit 2